jgi:hypothetical protein
MFFKNSKNLSEPTSSTQNQEQTKQIKISQFFFVG